MMNRREEIEARLYQLSVRPLEPVSVAAMHAAQRHAEPPKPWTLAIARMRAAQGLPAATPRCTCEPPKPWTLALAARRAAEQQKPPQVSVPMVAGYPERGEDEAGVPKPWSIALAARRAAEGR